MSYAYSNFGSLPNSQGAQGDSGQGIAFDEFGNYDFQDRSIVNLVDTQVVSISDRGSGFISIAPIHTSYIQTNQISNNGSSPIVIDSPVRGDILTLTDKLLITADEDINPGLNEAQFHIASTGNTFIFLESDTDNVTDTDISHIIMSEDSGQSLHVLRGGNNRLDFVTGTTAGPNGYLFKIGTPIDVAKGLLPSFNNEVDILEIDSNAVMPYVNLDMNAHDIINVNSITADKAYISNPTLNETQGNVLVYNSSSDEIEYRTSFPNPFNQSLDTTDNPTFNTLTSNTSKTVSLAGINDGTVATIAEDSSSFVIDGGCLFALLNRMSLSQISTPSTPGGFTGFFYNKTGGFLCWKNQNGYEYVINDYFGKYQGYSESLTLSSSTDTSNYTSKVSVPSQFYGAGTYMVAFSCLAGNQLSSQSTELRLLEDGIGINTNPIRTPGLNSGSDGIPMTQWYRRILTAGNHTFELQFKPKANTGIILDAKVWIYQIA